MEFLPCNLGKGPVPVAFRSAGSGGTNDDRESVRNMALQLDASGTWAAVPQ